MTQHTLGPWTIERVGIGPEKGMAFRILGNSGDPKRSEIAVTYYKPMIEEAEANARLIAAAPDMYDDHRANRDDAAGAATALNDYLSTVVDDGRLEAARLLIAAVSRRSEAAIAWAETTGNPNETPRKA